MSLWGRIFAACYDRCMASSERAGLGERRLALLAGLQGRVIEIGAGTGVNLAYYPASVAELVLAEPEPPMAIRLRRKLGDYRLPATVISAPGEMLPFADQSFDAAVATLVLCTVDSPARTLAELRRVLKPGGRLVFMEHVRSEDRKLATWQDRLQPVWGRIGHGCHCNRATLESITAAGFEVEQVQQGRIPKAAPIVRPLIQGMATAPAG